MTARASKPCSVAGCPALATRGGRCAEHNREQEQRRVERGTKDGFYTSSRWRKFRRWFLRRHPNCAVCMAEQRMTTANHVHHVIPRRERPELALAEDNCMAVCAACHNRIEPRGAGA